MSSFFASAHKVSLQANSTRSTLFDVVATRLLSFPGVPTLSGTSMVLPVTMIADVVYNPLDFASVNTGIGSDTRHIESCVGLCVKMKRFTACCIIYAIF
jgi:hypothetical protein